jgi:hypothetical protein
VQRGALAANGGSKATKRDGMGREANRDGKALERAAVRRERAPEITRV